MSELKKLDLNHYKPLGEVVFDFLRDAIMTGELKPGQRLMENTIADELGVSRTPVREAIRKLEKENFITMVPRKGAYVSKLTLKDILDVLEVRRVLEGFASELAATRMTLEEVEGLKRIHEDFKRSFDQNRLEGMIEKDREFHDLIFKASKNHRLIGLVTELHEQFHRFRLIYFNEFSDFENIVSWHQSILEAIESKDPISARIHAQDHVMAIEESVVAWTKEQGEVNV